MNINFLYTTLKKLIINLRESCTHEIALKELRDKHPTCILKNANLNNVELGEYVAVLTGASLQNCSIGDHSYISTNSKITSCIIGKFCSIGSNVTIGLGPHPTRCFGHSCNYILHHAVCIRPYIS